VCQGGKLTTVTDTEFLSTYAQARLEILTAAKNNESIQVLIQAHGEELPFPNDSLETLQVRQRSPSPGVEEDPTFGNYDGYHHDYGVPFTADEDASDEEVPERTPVVKEEASEEAVLPTGMTDDEQDLGEELLPGQLSEILLGPLTVKKEENSITDAADQAHGVWEEGVDNIFKVDNESSAIGIVIDPGATATLLKVEDAQALYGKGYLSQVECSQKKFRVAN
jgi:hypothetical protein